MSYKVDFKDLEKIEKLLDTLGDKATPIAKQMVYVGAGDVANSVRTSLLSKVSDEATGDLANGLDTTAIRWTDLPYTTRYLFTDMTEKGNLWL